MITRYGTSNHSEVNERRNGEHFVFTKHRNKIIGIFLSITSGILFTANNFIINQFQVVVSDAVLVRCVIQTIIFSCIIYWNDDSFLPQRCSTKLLTLLQGLTGAIGLVSCLASISFMPVPDALCIIFTCPVITIILSAIILGDKLNCPKCVSGLIMVLGVVLVTQPPFLFNGSPTTLLFSSLLSPVHDDLYYVGVGLAGTGCFMGGLTRVLIAKCEGVSLPVLITWSAAWGILVSTVYCLLDPGSCILSPSITSISFKEWLLLLGLALSGLLAFTLMTQALKLISPNLVSSFRALELVLAFGVQSILTGHAPDTWSCVGGALILAGVLVLTFQEKITELYFPPQVSQTYLRAVADQSEYSRLVEEGRLSG